MHDTVTRNHRCRSMYELCQSVARFLEVVQPFPWNGHGVAHLSYLAIFEEIGVQYRVTRY